MAITHTSYGTAQNKTAATTVVVTTTALIPASTLLVLAITADNVAAATPTVSSVSALGSDTWTARAGATTQSGASTTAGSGVFVYCYTLFTTASVANGTNITVTFNASPTAKAVVLSGFSEMTGTLRNTVASAASTSGVPSVATTGTALVTGDLVIGVIGQENSGVSTVDTDTLNGSWVLGNSVFSSGGQAATNCAVQTQYKLVTATGAQTFNPPGGANDSVAIVFAMAPAPPVAPTARTISAAAGTPAQTAIDLTWSADSAAIPVPTYLIESSPNGSTGWTTVATGQTGQTGYTATGLTPGTAYYFRVTGSNSQGSSTSNVAGPIATSSYPKISTFIEPFTDLTAWTTVSGTPTVVGGQAVLDSTVAGETTQTPAFYDLTESSIFFKVTPSGVPATTSRTVYLGAYVDASNNARLTISRNPSSSTVGVLVSGGLTGGFSNPYNPATMPYLRMRLAGTIIAADYSVDGVNWTQTFSDDIGATLTAKLKSANIRLSASQVATDTTDPQTATVDSINVVPLAISQAAYRFYADGTEVASTALAAENTAYTADVSAADLNLLLRTRLQLQTTAATTATDDWQLQYERNASGTWTNIPDPGTLADSYPSTNQDATTRLDDAGRLEGQSFLGNGQRLARAGFYLRKVGTLTGNITAYLYPHTGTFGSTGAPPAGSTPLATSLPLVANTLTTSFAWVYFTFDQSYTLVNGTPYCIVVGYSGDASNYVDLGLDATSSTHAGNSVQFSSSWFSNNLADACFEVYTGTGAVVPFDSANLTDGAATTERLGLIDSYDVGGVSETVGTTTTEKGQSFLGTGVALSGTAFSVRNTTGATGNAVAKIYAHTGTFGSSGQPTGAPLATSDNVDVATFPTGAVSVFATFPFSGANRITLTNGTPYFAVVAYTGATTISMSATSGPGTHAGNKASFTSGSWQTSTADASFKVIPLSGGGTGSFVAGKVSEDGLVDDLGWTGSNYTEVLYAITLKSAALANADTLRFRVLYNGATTSVTYTQTPTINVTKGAGTTTGQPKVYLAGAFTKKPLKAFVGGSWVTKPVKVWTGSTWKTLT